MLDVGRVIAGLRLERGRWSWLKMSEEKPSSLRTINKIRPPSVFLKLAIKSDSQIIMCSGTLKEMNELLFEKQNLRVLLLELSMIIQC